MADSPPQTEQVPPKPTVPIEARIQQGLSNPQQSYFLGVAPDDPMNKMWGFAEKVYTARFVPEHARTPADVFYLCNRAHDLGIPWTTAMDKLFMTPSGKVGMEGAIMLGLLHSKGFQVKLLTSTKESAEYWIKRPGGPDAFEWSCEVTWDQAKEAGWPYQKDGSSLKPPWRDRANMLRWRSLAIVAKVVAADLLGGIYLPDEIADFDVELKPDAKGVYSAEAEADAKAEADPNLAVVLKPKPADIPADIKQPQTVDLSPQEAQNEAFLAEAARKQADKEAAKKKRDADKEAHDKHVAMEQAEAAKRAAEVSSDTGVTDDDIPPVNATEEPKPDPEAEAKAQATAALNDLKALMGGKASNDQFTSFVREYHGKKPESMSVWVEALGVLKQAIETDAKSIPVFFKDPADFGKKLQTLRPVVDAPPKAKKKTADEVPFAVWPNWSPLVTATARQVMAKNKLAEADFIQRFSRFNQEQMTDEDLRCTLILFRHYADTLMLQRRATGRNLSMADAYKMVCQEFGGDVSLDSDSIKVTKAIQYVTNELYQPS